MRSIKTRIILAAIVCVLIVGVFSSVYIYSYLTNIISEKSDSLDELNMNSIKNQLNARLQNFENLASLCSNDLQIAKAMEYEKIDTLEEKKGLLNIQNIMTAYYAGTNTKPYIDKLMVFNDDNVSVQLFLKNPNSLMDASLVQKLEVFKEVSANPAVNHNGKFAVSKSVFNGAECLAYLRPVYNFSTARYTGWFYMEVNPNWITEIIRHYPSGQYVVMQNNSLFPNSLEEEVVEGLPIEVLSTQERFSYKESVYRIHSTQLNLTELEIYAITNVTSIEKDQRPMIYSIIMVMTAAIFLAIVLLFILSNMITKPLSRLTSRIHKIADNDFSFDPEIEEGNTELADAGRMVNQMSGGIKNLLKESEEFYIQKKNADIALLQSQVNPHFLYNTLDSIYWMASIQQSIGIMTMTRSLSNLMKNLAKGVGDTVSLREELSLVQDYVNIQAIRYMESFQVIYNIKEEYLEDTIIKFTLQPIIENAIFHGIVPMGTYGTIVLNAKEDGEDLLIQVEDDGVGMNEEEIEKLYTKPTKTSGAQLSGIGVLNVHNRLKLYYGSKYGLFYESVKGKYTKATLRIPRQTIQGENNV